MAGIVVLLWRKDGKDSIPHDVSYLAFQRACQTDSEGLANSMNTIVPSSISRVKVAALGSYMHLLNVNDDFPGSSLTGNELEIGSKLCKWVVLVVTSATSRLQSLREEKRNSIKMMKKNKDGRTGDGGTRSSHLTRSSTSPTTHRGGGSRGGSSHNHRQSVGTPQPLSSSISRSQSGSSAINNHNNNSSIHAKGMKSVLPHRLSSMNHAEKFKQTVKSGK